MKEGRLHFNHLLYYHTCADTFSSHVLGIWDQVKRCVLGFDSSFICFCEDSTSDGALFTSHQRAATEQLLFFCFFFFNPLLFHLYQTHVSLGFTSSRRDCSNCLIAVLPNLHRSLAYKSLHKSLIFAIKDVWKGVPKINTWYIFVHELPEENSDLGG